MLANFRKQETAHRPMRDKRDILIGQSDRINTRVMSVDNQSVLGLDRHTNRILLTTVHHDLQNYILLKLLNLAVCRTEVLIYKSWSCLHQCMLSANQQLYISVSFQPISSFKIQNKLYMAALVTSNLQR